MKDMTRWGRDYLQVGNALGNIETNRYELLSRKYAEEYYSLKTEQEKIEERLSDLEKFREYEWIKAREYRARKKLQAIT